MFCGFFCFSTWEDRDHTFDNLSYNYKRLPILWGYWGSIYVFSHHEEFIFWKLMSYFWAGFGFALFVFCQNDRILRLKGTLIDNVLFKVRRLLSLWQSSKLCLNSSVLEASRNSFFHLWMSLTINMFFICLALSVFFN